MRYTPGRSGSRFRVASSSGVTPPMLGQLDAGRGHFFPLLALAGLVSLGLALVVSLDLAGFTSGVDVEVTSTLDVEMAGAVEAGTLLAFVGSTPRNSSRSDPATSPSMVAVTVWHDPTSGAVSRPAFQRPPPYSRARVTADPPPHGVTISVATPVSRTAPSTTSSTLTGRVRPRLAVNVVPVPATGSNQVALAAWGAKYSTVTSNDASVRLRLASVALHVTVARP